MSSFTEQWIHDFFPACMYAEVLPWRPIAVFAVAWKSVNTNNQVNSKIHKNKLASELHDLLSSRMSVYAVDYYLLVVHTHTHAPTHQKRSMRVTDCPAILSVTCCLSIFWLFTSQLFSRWTWKNREASRLFFYVCRVYYDCQVWRGQQ